jgi:hypothetical protein
MNMKWALLIIGCLMGRLAFAQNQNPNMDQIPNANQVPDLSSNPKWQAMQRFQKQVAKSPTDFWGKVVDQKGAPIEGAKATFNLGPKTLDDDADEDKIVVLTDAKGLFSLTGKTGGGFSVWVSKDGYYSDPDQASASLPYWRRMLYPQTSAFMRNGAWQPFPTEKQPTVFTLTKKGQPAADLIRKHVRVAMPKDGTPVDIDLVKGRVAAAGQGDLRVESWVTDNGKDLVHRYPWKCRVTVLGGGLQSRVDRLAFQAPASGYQLSDEVNMTTDGDHWSANMNKQYFLQIGGNRYARMHFWMGSGGHNFLDIDYFLNPKPNDLNLESAP